MTVKTFSGIGGAVEGSLGPVDIAVGPSVWMEVTKEEREAVVVGSMLVAEGERKKKKLK